MSTSSRSAHQATIGGLAKTAGVNVETVRYYQRIGLLDRPVRKHGAVRRYDMHDVRRLLFIRRAQALGFSLDEVRMLLTLADGKHCAETKKIAVTKLEAVDEKLAALAAMQKALRQLVTACSRGSRACGCPIIDALSAEDQ
jgi:MerR family mercuric resistance operon transcriptional regulator